MTKAKSRAFRPLRGRVHFFDKRQRNEPKKTLCAQGKSGKSSSRGFFYKTSMSCRKTPHIHVRRPPGLPATNWCPHLQKPRARARAKPEAGETAGSGTET